MFRGNARNSNFDFLIKLSKWTDHELIQVHAKLFTDRLIFGINILCPVFCSLAFKTKIINAKIKEIPKIIK